jgi:Astacin (Peptidase family M12A)
VKIYLENVNPNQVSNFNKVDPADHNNFGTPYDYRKHYFQQFIHIYCDHFSVSLVSIMHYPRQAFSKNGRDTIVPLDESFLNRIGASELSSGDVARIKNMYQCQGAQNPVDYSIPSSPVLPSFYNFLPSNQFQFPQLISAPQFLLG